MSSESRNLAESLPFELLEVIFKQLSGKDVTICRAVCRRWRDVIDSFPDEVWEEYCVREYWNPKTAHKRAELTYRELFKSLALWSKVETAKIRCKPVPIPNPKQFKMLKTKLAVMYHIGETKITHHGFGNTIDYYDMKTLELLSRERLRFLFSFYDENEKFITFVTLDQQLCVIPKSNKKIFSVGCLPREYSRIGYYTLFDEEVYFVNDNLMLCVARLKKKNGEEKIKTTELHKLQRNVLGVSHASKEKVIILNEECNIYCYSPENNKIIGVNKIDCSSHDIIYELCECGFDWSHPDIYEWISTFFDERLVNIMKKKCLDLCIHNHVILMGTCRQLLHIFKRPYNEHGHLMLYSARPDRSIDISRFCKTEAMGKDINQVDTIEIENGHKIVVMNEDKLFVLDLVHDGDSKESAHSDYPALKVAKKISRTKTKPGISTKLAKRGVTPQKRGAMYMFMSRTLEKRRRECYSLAQKSRN